MIDQLLTGIDPGSDAWWAAIAARGTPLIDAVTADRYAVTFLWRDPAGDERSSSIQRVWLNITGVTDHHQPGPPQSLQRISGTDVWYWRTELPSAWRGSYSLMPQDELGPFEQDTTSDAMAVRAWWRGLFDVAQADPLNPLRAWQGARGLPMSAAHLPAAPDQSAWSAVDRGVTAQHPSLRQYTWQSSRLGNSRPVWVFTTGDTAPAQRPLAILLDGHFWHANMPIAGPLQKLTDIGQLPPAVYLLIDNRDAARRALELPCNPEFWQAVEEELLPLLGEWEPHSSDPHDLLVAGQSFGGLSAVYAALHWPSRVGAAISLSGSFWWPNRDSSGAPGRLEQLLDMGVGGEGSQRFYLAAGTREPLILAANRRLRQRLGATHRSLAYHEVDGGHDALWWRGELLRGLMHLWSSR